jgi:hypothetical protein
MLSCLFSIMKENLSPQSTNLGRVMQFGAAVCKNLDWVLLKILSETMKELVHFEPIAKPSLGRMNITDIEIKYVDLSHLYVRINGT